MAHQIVELGRLALDLYSLALFFVLGIGVWQLPHFIFTTYLLAVGRLWAFVGCENCAASSKIVFLNERATPFTVAAPNVAVGAIVVVGVDVIASRALGFIAASWRLTHRLKRERAGVTSVDGMARTEPVQRARRARVVFIV